LWLPGFLIDWAVLLALTVLAFRLQRAHMMVRQYPWLYERKGLLKWSERQGG
jgi:hypothetical protein